MEENQEGRKELRKYGSKEVMKREGWKKEMKKTVSMEGRKGKDGRK